MLEGILASTNGVGKTCDSALAESTIGLSTTEAISKGNPLRSRPFRNISDIEYAAMAGSIGITIVDCTQLLITTHQLNLSLNTML